MVQAWLQRRNLVDGTACWVVGGDWTIEHYAHLSRTVANARTGVQKTILEVPLDWTEVNRLDTAGASLLVGLLGPESIQRQLRMDRTLEPDRRALLQVLATALAAQRTGAAAQAACRLGNFLASIGSTVERGWLGLLELTGFVGQILETWVRIVIHPRRWRLTAVTVQVHRTAVDAVPIVALLSFMVGTVVAFLGATVLARFGASIFAVHLVAFSFMREFGVLLPAILIAGRTASAYTAQIGSMKANEEIDALRASGLNPIELLVLPRVLALLVSLPLLSLVGILAGIAGGATVCALSLSISPNQFFVIVQGQVELRHLLVGLSKSPLFAVTIAAIGCHEGFKVSGSAQSVGDHTTSSVVQSIFMVILIDALAALCFMEMGW